MNEATVPTPAPLPLAPATPGDEDCVRVCSVSGTLAALAVLVAFFLPWVTIPRQIALEVQGRLEERLADAHREKTPLDADWQRLSGLLVDQGHVSGLDVFYWARTAVRHARATRPADTSPRDASQAAARGIFVAAIGLAVLPIFSLFLAVYFLVHRCRRARSLALIVAMLTGAGAIAAAGTYGIVRGALERETDPAIGLSVLLVAGAALFLAGAFGVRLRNWWRVFGGFLVVVTILALGVHAWVRWGGLP